MKCNFLSKHEVKAAYIVIRTLACIYFCVTIPFRIAFIPNITLDFLFLDLGASLLFVADSGLRLFWQIQDLIRLRKVLPIDEEQVLQLNQDKAKHHGNDFDNQLIVFRQQPLLVSFFSLVSALPLDYALLMLGYSSNTIKYILLMRVFLLMTLPSRVHDIAEYLESCGLKNIGIQRAWKLFFAMAIAGHWCCCVFYIVARAGAFNGQEMTWPEDAGIYERSVIEGKVTIELNDNALTTYIKSLYWAYITMITTGFGDITPLSIPETVWCIISMCFGVVITTCAIANLQIVVTNSDMAFAEYQRKTETIAKYMKYRRLPDDLQDRIFAFYRYQWDLLKGANEAKIMDELPSSIQQQVSNFMCRDLVASLPFLKKANLSLLNALAECIEINVYAPNDEIVRKDEILPGVLIVSRGEVEVFSGQKVVKKMRRLDNYASESLFSKTKSLESVKARTFCEIFLLPSLQFKQMVQSQCEESEVQTMKEMAMSHSKSRSKVNKLFGSAEDHIPRSKFDKILYPKSKFRYVWDLIIMIGCMYYTFSIPLHIMRYLEGKEVREHILSFVLSYIFDLCFAVDLLLRFNYFMYLEEGLLVFDRHCIRQKFRENHNLIGEILISLPIDILGTINSKWCFLLRLLKIFRLPLIFECFNNLQKTLTDFKLEKGLLMLKMFQLNFALVVTCHWIACVWHSSASISKLMDYENNWLLQDEEDDSLAIDHDRFLGRGGYLRSIYWAIVATSTVGYGDIVPTNTLETTVATITILFGGLILPAIVGGLAAYISNIDLAHRGHREKLHRVKKFLRERSIDNHVIEKIVNFYDYLWSRQGGVDEESVLNELPPSLRQAVSCHINRRHIDSVPFFYDMHDSFKDLLGLCLRIRVFMPDDNIIIAGEQGSSIFFMEKGKAAVLGTSDGNNCEMSVSCILEEGSYFGEGALLSSRAASATVKALTFCDLFELSRENFLDIVESTLDDATCQNLTRAIKDSLRKTKVINANYSKNLRERPKCHSRVSTVFHTIDYYQNQNEQEAARLINPDGRLYFFWCLLLLVAIVYNLWMIPFSICFSFSSQTARIMNWCSDAILLLDMYLSAYLVSFHKEGELIMNKTLIIEKYLKERCLLDIIRTLPLDIFYSTFVSGSLLQASMIHFLRFPRMFWIFRLPKVLKHVFSFLEDVDTNMAPLKLVEFLSGVVLIAHWAGCGFYAMAQISAYKQNCDSFIETGEVTSAIWTSQLADCRYQGTWLQRQLENLKLPADGGTVGERYLRSLNWALPTLVVVVIGDVVPINMDETCYAFFWMLVGVSINAAIIGNVANIVANINPDKLKFAKRSDEIKKMIQNSNLSLRLKGRIDSYMTELWEHKSDVHGDSFLVELPKSLQIQVTEKSRYWHISHCPFFDFCSNEIVKALSLRLKLKLYSSGDIIISFGDNGVEMFFLETGTVEIISEDGKTVFATLTTESNGGSSQRPSIFFGETSLFFKKRRSGTVQAVTFCEAYCLHKHDLDRELCLRFGRNVDLQRMVNMFTVIADSNARRNSAITTNLKLSRTSTSKLSQMIHPDESICIEKKFPNLFRPGSLFRIMWDILCLCLVLFSGLYSPFQAAFQYGDVQEHHSMSVWTIADSTIEFFFLVEFYLRFNHFPITQNGVIVTEMERIRAYHIEDGIYLDMLASIPAMSIARLLNLGHLQFIRLWHMLRFLRAQSYAARIGTYLNNANIRISAPTKLLIRIISFYVAIIHWFGCIWFCIHRYQFNTQFTWATTDCPNGNELAGYGCLSQWLPEEKHHDVCHGDLIRNCYVRAIYFVLTTMSTVGYGDISPTTPIETIFQNIVVLTGACFFAGIIGSFAEFLSNSDESGESAFKDKIRKLSDYMKYRNLPKPLQNEIIFYHTSRWNRSHIINEKEVITILSEPLQMDLSFEKLSDVVLQIPVLKECSLMLLKRICHALSLQICPNDTTIYHAGDVGFDIYFIASGLVKIILPTDSSILDDEGRSNVQRTEEKIKSIGCLLRKGNHFGETCIEGTSGVRRETVVASTTVELYRISKEDLDRIFSYTQEKEVTKLKRNLLWRNGTVWHTFEENKSTVSRRGNLVRSNSSKLGRSQRSFLAWTKPRSSLLSMSPSSSSSERSPIVEHNEAPSVYSRIRLRSFSVQAYKNLNQLEILHENMNAEADAMHAATLYETQKISSLREIYSSDQESSSGSSSVI